MTHPRGEEVLVWNGALSTTRLRLPCPDASAQATTGQAEETEPVAASDALEPGARRAPGGAGRQRVAPVASDASGSRRSAPRTDQLG